MNHQWKTTSLQELVKYNKWLLASTLALSVLCLILSVAVLEKEEKWVLIPCNDIDRKMVISDGGLYPSYLKEWATYIAKEVFTTSPEEVGIQHTKIRKISSGTKELSSFFNNQLAFIQGNGASSVFYVKSALPLQNAVRVNGTLHYWFTGSKEVIALEKSYVISYKEAARGLILLTNIEDDKEYYKKDE